MDCQALSAEAWRAWELSFFAHSYSFANTAQRADRSYCPTLWLSIQCRIQLFLTKPAVRIISSMTAKCLTDPLSLASSTNMTKGLTLWFYATITLVCWSKFISPLHQGKNLALIAQGLSPWVPWTVHNLLSPRKQRSRNGVHQTEQRSY